MHDRRIVSLSTAFSDADLDSFITHQTTFLHLSYNLRASASTKTFLIPSFEHLRQCATSSIPLSRCRHSHPPSFRSRSSLTRRPSLSDLSRYYHLCMADSRLSLLQATQLSRHQALKRAPRPTSLLHLQLSLKVLDCQSMRALEAETIAGHP